MSMSVETTAPALDRLIETSGISARVAVIPLLHEEMKRPDATFEPVLKALKADRELAAHVRHAACSAYFGGHVADFDLAEAFSRMGITEFHRAVCTAVIHTRMARAAAPAFISHADHVARLCELLASRCAATLVTDACFAGLCHDAAVPVMSESLTDYQYFAEQALSHEPGVIELERECHGFDHGEAGAMLVSAMGFTPAIALAVRHHHEPGRLVEMSGDAGRLLAMLVIAERVIAVSQEQSASVFVETSEGAVQRACEELLGVDSERLRSLETELLEHCRLRRKAA